MNSIPVGVTGEILDGEHRGMKVRVEDDSGNTGGYLIFQWWSGSQGPNADGAFDDWVENEEQLKAYFEESNWRLAWGKGD
jgi:hypothetical protein